MTHYCMSVRPLSAYGLWSWFELALSPGASQSRDVTGRASVRLIGVGYAARSRAGKESGEGAAFLVSVAFVTSGKERATRAGGRGQCGGGSQLSTLPRSPPPPRPAPARTERPAAAAVSSEITGPVMAGQASTLRSRLGFRFSIAASGGCFIAAAEKPQTGVPRMGLALFQPTAAAARVQFAVTTGRIRTLPDAAPVRAGPSGLCSAREALLHPSPARPSRAPSCRGPSGAVARRIGAAAGDGARGNLSPVCLPFCPRFVSRAARAID